LIWGIAKSKMQTLTSFLNYLASINWVLDPSISVMFQAVSINISSEMKVVGQEHLTDIGLEIYTRNFDGNQTKTFYYFNKNLCIESVKLVNQGQFRNVYTITNVEVGNEYLIISVQNNSSSYTATIRLNFSNQLEIFVFSVQYETGYKIFLQPA
jgi:hypothetical protein